MYMYIHDIVCVCKYYTYVYIHTCVYIFYTSNEKESPCLNEDDARLLKHVCKRLNLPVQYPVAVCYLKRVSVIDNPTGRMIDYRSSNESATCFNVVSVNSKSPVPQFGMIKNLFVYRGINFAILEIFECPVHTSDDIVHITNCTNTSRAVFPLAEVSRPLVIAIKHLPQFYILNF